MRLLQTLVALGLLTGCVWADDTLPDIQQYGGVLRCQGTICIGHVVDNDGCRHKVSLDQSAIPWLFDFPSKDSCGDPVNVPDEIVDLTPQTISSTPHGRQIISGPYVSEPVCWLAAAQGNWAMTFRKSKGGFTIWSFYLIGNRTDVIYGSGCGGFP